MLVSSSLLAVTVLAAAPEKRITCGGSYGWSVSAPACPPPQWEPRWEMNLSTVTESAANTSGFYDTEKASQWGVITMDWQDGAALWQDALPGHTGEAVLVEQCRRIKARSTGTRCMVYRQNELAVQWQESSRSAMTQTHADKNWFLTFKNRSLCESAAACNVAAYHNMNGGGPLTPCKKPATLSEPNCAYCCNFTQSNGTGVYNEPLGGPWRGHGPYNVTRFGNNSLGDAQLFWDFRNKDVQAFVAEKVLAAAATSEYVDGIFVDDPSGYGQEHPAVQSMVQLTPAEVAELQLGTQQAWLKALHMLLPKKKYIIQAYSNVAFPSGSTTAVCSQWMRKQCAVPANESTSTFVVGHDVNMSVAAFLVARGPYSLITMNKAVIEGRNWSDPEYRSYRLDTGVPTGGCIEGPTSVFSRSWSGGHATVDCAAGNAALDFALLPRTDLTEPSVAPMKSDDTTTTIDNTKPRTDTTGAIVNAHQGRITWNSQAGRYYWVGSAWVPCKACPGVYGCCNNTFTACGFDNNNISVYSSATLANDGWRLETSDAVPRATRPVGSYWQANMEYNPTTKLWVLWWLYSLPHKDASDTTALVATATTPAGPFMVANASGVTLRFPTFTSAELFVDGTDAYVLYSSRQSGGELPVIERLNPAWTDTVGGAAPAAPIQPFPPPGESSCEEGEVMFRRGKIYYLLMGRCCCFCGFGANIRVYTSTAAMGPWSMANEINTQPSGGRNYTLPCQQQGVTVLGSGKKDGHGFAQLMWSGDRWQQSPDGRKEHDPQMWIRMEFGDDGTIANLTNCSTWSPEVAAAAPCT
jgi:hypothetical protein